jgi:predicted nucleotidyltransferase
MRQSDPQSHLRYPLTRLLGNGGNVRVLRALAAYGAPLSASQLALETGLTPQGVRLVLDGLQAQRIVNVLGTARSQLFVLNADHPFATPLRGLFATEQQRWEQLLQALRDALKAERHVRSAWLYGSVARGEDAPHSDIDIALVMARPQPAVAERVRAALLPLEQSQQVSFSVAAVSEDELAKLRPGDRWWSELERDAKPLKGSSPQQEMARARRAAVAR